MTVSSGSFAQSTKREFLSFRIGEQEYCVDIMAVREIRGWSRPTPLPHAEDHIRGVINLRGTVILIVDLARRLGISQQEENPRNVIIVSRIRNQTVGLMVDAVSDILAVPEADIQLPPDLMSFHESALVKSLMIVEDRMLRVLDLEAVLPDHLRGAA